MYGMVNKAIRTMIIELTSEKEWKEICDNIEYKEYDFEVFKQYEDSITLNLVLTISKKLKKEPPEILESFGEYWIEFAYKSDYKELLETFASSPNDLIKSLNNLHDRLELSFDELTPPSFDIVEETDSYITVNYYTNRDMPLEYFVKGLLQGIFKHFNQKCDVVMLDETLGDAKQSFRINL
jgi:hypothetical protein